MQPEQDPARSIQTTRSETGEESETDGLQLTQCKMSGDDQ